MNTMKVTLSVIFQVIESRPADAALPCNLNDVILHQIARDLRLIDHCRSVDGRINSHTLRPMFLIRSLMLQQSEILKGPGQFQYLGERLQHWLQRYMYYVEREVVSRVVKLPCPSDTVDLISEIRQDLLTDKAFLANH